MAHEILRVQDVKKHFGGVMAVDGASFSVEEQTIRGLIGANGAGKTTLFNVITGYYKLDSGTIYFKDERVDKISTYKKARKGMVRTFQLTKVLARMTVLENMLLGPKLQTGEQICNIFFRPKKVLDEEAKIMEKALETLEFFDLMHMKDDYAGALSGGQKRLLEMARALMADPKMLLLDEPFAGVNPTLARKLVSRIKELKERGMTFLIIEHDMPLITEVSDTLSFMNQGRIILEGPPEDVKKDPRVLDAYLGDGT
ncbi:MAG: ABC transporter ATP-binding protein [Methanosarcinales archaeon]|nr:ABC transporter ATP-binding protein [ANME-2 cluster archaeon]MDF1532777.1 ABC transporter ATP-binding protein [ANME-2 cluster archaeon]MDW7775831.1 ABC transporter ATP-binding protein [Methanosarcinales archaeon]